MLHGVVVVFSLLSPALGEIFPVINHTNFTGELNPRVQGVCYFGRVPSARCMFRCFMKGTTAYCDEALCQCRSEDKEINPAPNHTAFPEIPTTISPFIPIPDNSTALNQTQPAVHRLTFFIFDLGKLFGVPEENTTAILDTSSHGIPVRPQQLWTLPHILAVAILTLLTVLVVLEVLHCCRLRKNKNNHFHNVLSSSTLENVYVPEKQ